MPQFFFHTGTMYGKGSGPNATPQEFGTLQSGSIDLSYTNKSLYGQYNAPVATGRGNLKISGKASSAAIQARFFNDLFCGGTLSKGQTVIAQNEVASVPSATAYTVTAANAATFVEDWAVKYGSNGAPLIKVASDPAQGQYSVANGVYTFAAADAGAEVLLSYSYTDATNGQSILVTQQLVGVAPEFSLVLNGNFNGAAMSLKLFAAVSTKLSFATKLNDFMIPAFEFEGQADAAGRIYQLNTSDGAA